MTVDWLRHRRRVPVSGLLVLLFGVVAVVLMLPPPAAAQPATPEKNSYFVTLDAVIRAIRQSAEFSQLVETHNQQAEAWSDDEIHARDRRWRQGDKTLIEPLLANQLSKALAKVAAASDGVVAEIIVMGKRGCNIAISSVTSDYWQGDEAKWKRTFGADTSDRFIDRVDFDKSTNTYAQQISQRLTINGKPVGAITIGFDIVYRPK
ncbi:MAG: hypothetical protein AAGC70_19855 [Pseudomonadota bacterium]